MEDSTNALRIIPLKCFFQCGVISRNILQCNVYFLPANPNQERKNSKFVVKVDILSWRELAPS